MSTALIRKNTIIVPENGTNHCIFSDVPVERQITKTTEIGIRVAVAKYPDTQKIYLFKYHPIGDLHFPRGGVTVFNDTLSQKQSFYFESVAIHSKVEYYRFINQPDENSLDNSEEMVDTKPITVKRK